MFSPPTNCPSCDSTLVWREDLLYCVNSGCSAQAYKQIEHFAKTMKLKGLGPETIKKLNLTSILDLYNNDFSALSSDKIREKLVLELERSKTRPLNEVLPALGIPLIGKSATSKLAQVCDTVFDINDSTCRLAGLGEKTTNNLLDWLAVNLEEYLSLPFDFMFEKSSETKGVVCITGRLTSYKTKDEARQALESAGWKVVDSVTKEVTHLINESGKSSAKTQKAEASGVIIVNSVNELI